MLIRGNKKFFAQVIVGCLAQCFGPVSQLTENSKYYSANPPQRIRTGVLPHITIQCPVYKEGLQGVIAPTIKSIKQAISTYELQGGTANIFINDDGLQLFKEEEEHLRKERIDFYADHNIGWVARPGHGKDGFVRKGKFKKVCLRFPDVEIKCFVLKPLLRGGLCFVSIVNSRPLSSYHNFCRCLSAPPYFLFFSHLIG